MKFIVDNRSKLSDREAFGRVISVIDGGRMSRSKHGPQYCFVTAFHDGVHVCAMKREKSEKFIVSGPES